MTWGRVPGTPYLLFVSLILHLGAAQQSSAIQGLELHLGSLSQSGWGVQGLALEFEWKEAASAGWRLHVQQLNLPGLSRPVSDLVVTCASGRITGRQIACDNASVRLRDSSLGIERFDLNIAWTPGAQRFRLGIRNLELGSGRVQGDFQFDAGRWQAALRGQSLELETLERLLKANGLATQDWTVSGSFSADIRASGDEQGLWVARWQAGMSSAAFSDPTAIWLGERVQGRLSGKVQRQAAGYTGEASLKIEAGELLTPAFYLSPPDGGVELKGRFNLGGADQTLAVESLSYLHPGVLEARLSGRVDLARGLEGASFSLHTGTIPLQAFYTEYLGPVLAEGPLADLRFAGTARVSAEVVTGTAQRLEVRLVNVDVEGVRIDDAGQAEDRLFGLFGTDAHLLWTPDDAPSISRLSWERGHVLGKIPLGAGNLDVGLHGSAVRLLSPTVIPVLDGGLNISRFSFARSGSGAGALQFDGILTPVSLRLVSELLDWPPMAGQVSGVIPDVSYREGRLLVAGVVLVRAFDGRLLIRNLQVADLLGVFPTLRAEIELRNLDLEKLTGAFSFGKITGRLDGEIKALVLEDWAPVAFDARLYTPEGDSSKHRISQRAVDNISNIGGTGASGAVSRSLLRFFEDFSYKRLGIRCRLRRGVCHMAGVAPAEQGYYLVQGGGIPRISIIGYNRRTDWNLLLKQLRDITARGAASTD